MIATVVIAFTIVEGLAGLLIGVMLCALGAAVYTLVTNKPGMMNLPSRAWAGAVLAAALALSLPASMLTDPPDQAPAAAPTASPTPAAVDPEPDEAEAPDEREAKPTSTAEPETEDAAPDPEAPSPSVPNDPDGRTALGLLETIPVKGPAAATGYDRVVQFGESWPDTDGNGCDTRNDILVRDLQDVDRDGSCRVISGTLVGPYTGKQIAFQRGQDTSHLVQIDHVVALQNAWITGAQQTTYEVRVAFANDPLNLLAVDGPTNSSKGSSNAASWLPPNKAFRCDYVARQISVKAAYGLWVVPPEKEAMQRVLSACPDQPAYASGYDAAPNVEPRAEPEPPVEEPAPAPAPAPQEEQPPPAPEHVHFENCTAARDAGAAPRASRRSGIRAPSRPRRGRRRLRVELGGSPPRGPRRLAHRRRISNVI
ncbi:hypothetical protein GCM10010915_11260 [Microbacterium faecale]|uniref:GmrSD restriction endonucleases C-terminal domain-containing protein n=1 Tax=Microbacterium faecale TaxID=1804630 RepID=A0A916Y718_9MICO|nr:hypothetical protein GCM10010915_11260 [Microbacterium faecale]